MTNNPYAAYQKNVEIVDSKEDLLLKTYEEIISLLNVAVLSIEEGDIKTKAESLTKVTNALSVLKASLDFENGGEIAQNLDRLYDFCMEELLKANLNNDKELVKNVIEVLTPVYEGFKEAFQKAK
ncbi:flagellar export chaperone FliS [Persephonella sp.]